MSDFIESGRNFASDVSVDGDHDAQQYVIGFEDSDGSFVEVGRIDNAAADVTEPLEIKHANSGERITLDSSGFETRSVTSTGSVTVTDGEATDSLHYGSNQDRANAGKRGTAIGIESRVPIDDQTSLGFQAGKNNSGGGLTAFGRSAAEDNTANGATCVGLDAGARNQGNLSTIVGLLAGADNVAPESTLIGRSAGELNQGKQSTLIGAFSGAENDGRRNTAVGVNASRGDSASTGGDNIGIGFGAIRNTTASGIIGIGQFAGDAATTDDQLIITDRAGNRRMVMDLTNGNLEIDGTLTENVTL
jgi:hypothetical protein